MFGKYTEENYKRYTFSMENALGNAKVLDRDNEPSSYQEMLMN